MAVAAMLKMGQGLAVRSSLIVLSIRSVSVISVNEAAATALPDTSCAQAIDALGDTLSV